jgi:hypothetical protein
MDYTRYESIQHENTAELNRAIPVHTPANITDALGTVDTMIPTYTNNFNPAQFTSLFAKNSNAVAMDRECRNIASPDLTMRDPSARTGCGWWYVNSPNKSSTGAYGTRRGPMSPNLDAMYGSGEWLWDPREAMQKEAGKSTSKILKCSDIQFSPIPNMGWCTSTNMAILTDGKGNPAFPNDPRGDCPNNGTIITSASECNPSMLTAAPAPSRGRSANTEGFSSAPCNDGSLSPYCIRSVVDQQCPGGTLSQALVSGYASTSNTFNDMHAVLQERNFSIPAGIVNDGKLSMSDVFSAVSKIKTLSNDSDLRSSGAAKNLCFGNPFDACSFPNSTGKPFSAKCITKVALAAGWSPSGTAMPNNSMDAWNSLNTWGDVLNQVSAWKMGADTVGPDQLNLIEKVYGIKAKAPNRCPSVIVSQHCDDSGWEETIPGSGTFYANTDFKQDASFIKVPDSATAVLTNGNGQSYTIVGPKKFSLCERSGFNDNVKKIVVYRTGYAPVTPYDNFVTYQKDDKILWNGSTYKLSEFIGAAGYAPDHGGSGHLWKRQ